MRALLMSLALVASVLTGCGGSETNPEDQPTPIQDQDAANPDRQPGDEWGAPPLGKPRPKLLPNEVEPEEDD
jgi:hypothetical protein